MQERMMYMRVVGGQVGSQQVDIGGPDMPGSSEALGTVLDARATWRWSAMGVLAGVVISCTLKGSARLKDQQDQAPMYNTCTRKRLLGVECVQEQPLVNVERGVEQRGPSRAPQNS